MPRLSSIHITKSGQIAGPKTLEHNVDILSNHDSTIQVVGIYALQSFITSIWPDVIGD